MPRVMSLVLVVYLFTLRIFPLRSFQYEPCSLHVKKADLDWFTINPDFKPSRTTARLFKFSFALDRDSCYNNFGFYIIFATPTLPLHQYLCAISL